MIPQTKLLSSISLQKVSTLHLYTDVARFYKKGLLLLIFLVDSMPEFFMNNTVVTGNLQHGLFLENTRNYVIVNASTITHNGYGAGIRIYGGASEQIVFHIDVLC